jgi:hypothetical protein
MKKHREFLLWLSPRLEAGATTGLGRDQLGAIREELTDMRNAGPLQPFASRLWLLVKDTSVLEPAAVAELAREARAELAPPREQTVVLSDSSSDDE